VKTEPSRAGEAPIMIEELSGALDESVVGRAVRRVRILCVAAVSDSAVVRAAANAGAAWPDVESRLLIGGYVLAVAMLVHISMLAFAEPYAYPGHSRYWLPGALLVFAAVVSVFRGPIAAAWRDRRERG
jgi:hypothetical protein